MKGPFALGAALLAAGATASLTVTEVLRVQNNRTWWGDVSIAMAGPADPVLLLSSWVFKPALVEAFRPAKAGSTRIWATNVSGDWERETLYVASTVPYGGAGGPAPPAVDTLILWNAKDLNQMTGPLILFGTSSQTAPDLDGGKGVAWNITLNAQSANVNLWVPMTWIALADDGSTGVAWIMDGLGATTVVGFNGQTGAVTWNNTISVNATYAQYAYSYGADVSGDGKWAIYDSGVVGLTNQTLYVVSTATGALRGAAPVQSVGLINGRLSHDGTYTFVQMDPMAPEATVMKWDEGSGAYVTVGSVQGPNPSGTNGGNGWYLDDASFGYDPASGTTVFGAVWLTADLEGNIAAGVWDVSKLAAGPVASFNWTSTQTDIAVSQAEISCAGLLCALALNTFKVNGTMPTAVVLSAEGDGASWSYVTPGSMLAASVNVGVDATTGARDYYVAVSGCTTYATCTDKGADAYLWHVTGAK